jgi:hypothetical protein
MIRITLFDLISTEKSQNPSDSSQEPPSRTYIQRFLHPANPDFGHDDLVAKYVGLWSVLAKPEAQRYSMQALLGLRSLVSGRTRIANEIFKEIEFQTSTAAALSYVMIGVGRFLAVVIVSTILIIYGIVTMNLFLNKHIDFGLLTTTSGDMSVSGDVLVAAFSGMIGSVVSVLLRLGEFETTRGRSRIFLTLTGGTLPIVGGVFGAFVAALLSSKVVNITVGNAEGSNAWLYIVIGFLCGFSERFSRGFIRIAENQFVGAGDPGSRQGGATTAFVASSPPDRVTSSTTSLPPTTPRSR